MAGKHAAKLLEGLDPFPRIVIVTHDNPDPDAIASGWGLRLLVEKSLDRTPRLVAGGAIVRAENRHLVKLLEPPLELVDELAAEEGTAYVFVDCAPEAGNHVLQCAEPGRVAVVDHHRGGRGRQPLLFRDVRPGAAAAASIVAEYLRSRQIVPETALATALLYAIRTETTGSAFFHANIDRRALNWLTPLADPAMVARIASAPLSREYFGDLVLALQNTFIYDDTALCLLPRARGQEVVGEMADLLIRHDDVRRVLCAAAVKRRVLVSVRTVEGGDDARVLIRDTLSGLGRGGGHRHRAGGGIRAQPSGPQMPESLQERLRQRWLAACGVRRQRGKRLVAVREIMSVLG